MPSVQVSENEPFEIALRRFKRGCEKAGILTETRRREFYEKPTAMRKRKIAAATKRCRRKAKSNRFCCGAREATTTTVRGIISIET